MKIIIMCAGRSKRFGTHRPKPLALVEGVPNCVRTWNLVHELTQTCSYLTVNKDRKNYFDVLDQPIQSYLIVGDSQRETQRYSNAFPLSGETVFLYGDVIYSIEDLSLILSQVETTTWYGRIGSNPVTGKKCDELMGVHVIDYLKFEDAVKEVDRQMKEREKENKQLVGMYTRYTKD